jgi:hypothetical protein
MRLVRTAHATWAVVCIALLVFLIAVRWVRYASWSSAPGLDALLAQLMILDVQTFLWGWVHTTIKLEIVLIATAVLVVGLHRRLPQRLVHHAGDVWRLQPLAVSMLLGAMLWWHYLFDLNVTIALVCAGSLVITWLSERWPPPRPVMSVAWAGFFTAWMVAAWDATDRLTIALWGIVLFALARWAAPRVGRRELALARVSAVMPMNLLPALLPLALPLHGGTYMGDGLAYGYCEVPGRGTVYATVPVCGSVQPSYEKCLAGRVVEYDLGSKKPIAERNYFSPAFYGRLEQIECLDDEVHVAIQGAWVRGEPFGNSVLAFPVSAPDSFNPALAGPGVGITMAYDRAHDAVFYSAEFTHRVVRYDRATGRIDEVDGHELAHEWFEPVTLYRRTGSASLFTHSVDRRRNRVYLEEFMHGRYAFGIDLTTLKVVTRYDVGGGGALGISVDPERDRLFVSSVWGLDVFDLKTDRRIARKRMGTGNRPVIVDAPRNRLYVNSTVEGKIRILDRDSFEVIGQIPIGVGSRYPHLSTDGRTFFASSTAAHYYWDADTLAPRG